MFFRYNPRHYQFNPDDPANPPLAAEVKARIAAMLELEEELIPAPNVTPKKKELKSEEIAESELAMALAGLSQKPKKSKSKSKTIKTKKKPLKKAQDGGYQCGKCHQFGHNARTCGVSGKITGRKVPTRVSQDSGYQCSKCHRLGHNARTCSFKKVPTKVKTVSRPKSKSKSSGYQCGKCLRRGHNARTCEG